MGVARVSIIRNCRARDEQFCLVVPDPIEQLIKGDLQLYSNEKWFREPTYCPGSALINVQQ